MIKKRVLLCNLLTVAAAFTLYSGELKTERLEPHSEPGLKALLHVSKHGLKRLCYSNTGKTLAVIDNEDTIRLWDLIRSVELCKIPRISSPIATNLAFNPDDRILAFAETCNSISFYDCRESRSISRIEWKKNMMIIAFSISNDFTKLAIIGYDKHKMTEDKLCLYDIRWSNRPITLRIKECLTVKLTQLKIDPRKLMYFLENKTFELSADGNNLVLAAGSIYLINTHTGSRVNTLHTNDGRVTASIVVSPKNNLLSSSTEVLEGDFIRYSNIILWDIKSAKQLWKASPKRTIGVCLDHSPDGWTLVSGGDGGPLRLWEVISGKEIQCWPYSVHHIFVRSLSFSPDGSAFAAAMSDGTVRIYDPKPMGWSPPRRKQTRHDLNRLWTDVASDDSGTAYKAIYTLIDSRDGATAFLRERLHPIPTATSQHISRLVADLDDDSFQRREAASKALACLGAQAEDALRKVLANPPSPEVRIRAERLLNTLPSWTVKDPQVLRTLRAIWVLQRIGTPEARALLEKLARGSPAERQTQEAKAAFGLLDRMKKR